MKKKLLNYGLSVCLILTFQACGGTTSDKDSGPTKETKSYLLTKDNYIELAKYNFLNESKELQKRATISENDTNNNSKFRTYPGDRRAKKSGKNALTIESVTPFNSYIESLKITSDKREIKVEVKNRLYVVVSLYENGKVLATKKIPLEKFRSYDLDSLGGLS